MSVFLDGVEALYQLLDGMQVRDPGGDLLQVDLGDGDGPVEVPPAVTVLDLPADAFDRIADEGIVYLVLSRAGWSDDKQMVEGHERVTVEVLAATRTLTSAFSQAIEVALVDQFHDVPGVGFIDDVLIDTRWRVLRQPGELHTRSSGTYRLVSRPD